MKIYIASSWRNQLQPNVVNQLRNAGHEVYDFKNPSPNTGFAWSSIDPNWEKWTNEEYFKALDHPLAVAGFKSDFDAMNWADACVLVMPCGRSAHTEAGWMQGAGKPTIVLIETEAEPELMYKIFELVTDKMSEVISHLEMIEIIMSEDIKNPFACFGRKPHRMDFEDSGEYLKRLADFNQWEIEH